jgi:hypothetical protein
LIPELRRGLFSFRFEDDAHVFLMAEAAALGDFGEREMGVKEQALGGGDALADQFPVDRAAKGGPEAALKHAA